MEQKKRPFLSMLGVIALFAGLITLGKFILTGMVVDYWSFRWIIGIVFIVFLMGVGFYLLDLGGEKNSSKEILPVFGGIYGILSIMFYIWFGITFIEEGAKASAFLGFLLLFFVMTVISIFCILTVSSKSLRLLSYGFAGANTICVVLVINKYIFSSGIFYFPQFLGESVLLIIGATLFMKLYFTSENE
jgi:hypothetical protein